MWNPTIDAASKDQGARREPTDEVQSPLLDFPRFFVRCAHDSRSRHWHRVAIPDASERRAMASSPFPLRRFPFWLSAMGNASRTTGSWRCSMHGASWATKISDRCGVAKENWDSTSTCHDCLVRQGHYPYCPFGYATTIMGFNGLALSPFAVVEMIGSRFGNALPCLSNGREVNNAINHQAFLG